jgi:quercetin dioxygenase-like cupin family protein
MEIRISAIGLAALACATMMSDGAPAASDATMPMNVVAGPEGVKWGPPPPILPPGSELAVMSGDPSKPGFVSLRAKVPAGYTISPHTHPTDEHVVVLSGTMAFGMGDKVDASAETAVNPGGYFVAVAGMHHYAVARTDAVIQIDMEGPFELTYINPADDPRNKK